MEHSLFIDKRDRRRGIILSIASGILLSLAFPNFNFSILAWFALVPLLFILDTKNPLISLRQGFICGVTFFLITINWLVNTMTNYGHLPVYLSYLILLLLVCYLSLYFAMFCYLLALLSKRDIAYKWISAPLLWVSLEFIRAHLLTGFPWASLGYSQYTSLKIIQIADITGVYGISFLVMMVNSAICYFIENFLIDNKADIPTRWSGRFNLKPICLALIIWSLSYIYGIFRTDENIALEPSAPSIKGMLIQGNIDQDKKWDKNFKEEVLSIYKEMSINNPDNPAPSENIEPLEQTENLLTPEQKNTPDIIVWPETATPFFFSNEEEYKAIMLDIARQTGTYLFFGSPRYEYGKDGSINMYNSSFLLSHTPKIEGSYDKIHLVPFGEYVPLKSMLWFVDKMVEGIGEFRSGTDFKVFSIPDKGDFGTLICFESIFPEISRGFVKNGADFMINITNDAWFGRSAASSQHLSMAVMRAVENRTPIMRAANTGISAFINHYGKILSPTELFVRASVSGEIYPKAPGKVTFYTSYGDIFTYLCLLCTAAIFVKRYGN